MLFNSFAFAVFFPAVTLLYFLLPYGVRWAWLLTASCFFYMYYKPVYILILAITITTDYFAARLIANTANATKKKYWLVASLLCNIGVLIIFKYYNFFDNSISALLHYSHPISPLLRLALPIGLSFHTFQAMSYTIEVYKGRQEPERHFGIFALYVLFFPQLVAGPIERPQHLLHQFRERHDFNGANAVEGLQMMMWGIFKKAVIADRLALITDRVFWTPGNFGPVTTLVSALFFSMQIYCDFSGYCDIAVGSARIMGYDLSRNFNRPYAATGIIDLWRRWHISLSTWFRDYVYLPLGGNKAGFYRQAINVMIVFVLSGLWHGAAVTFIIWGALHGLLYIGELALKRLGILHRPRNGISTALGIITTFLLSSLTRIFFRASSIDKSMIMLGNLTHLPAQLLAHKQGASFMADHPATRWQLATCLFFLAIMITVEWLQVTHNVPLWLQQKSRAVRWSVYYLLLLFILFFGVFGNRQFIYFQF